MAAPAGVYPEQVRRTLVALLIAALLAGCSSSGPASQSGGGSTGLDLAPSSTPTTVSTPPTPPARTIAWSSCPGHSGWDCGTLQVPLNPAEPTGPTIGIALNRHRATDPSQRIGSLLINPGGPGASGIDFAYEAVPGLLDSSLIAHFDIIGFDPRGVGASSPIACTDGPTLDRINHLDPVPSTPAKLAALIAGAKELDADCESRSGSILPYVATVNVAKDLDLIRAALGDSKLSYLGFSYGTLIGATYASLFPTHIRALVLDSAIDPDVDEATQSLAQAVGFEGDLNAFLTWCTTAGSSCAFKADGAPNLRAAFNALAARVDVNALPGSGDLTLGPAEMLLGVANPLYDSSAWPDLAAALAAAQAGNGLPLLEEYESYIGRSPNGTYDNEEVSNIAVNCLDLPAPSLAQVDSMESTAAQMAPYFGPPLIFDDLNCLYWPVPPVTRPEALHAPGAPPILVVGSTGDPATPYAWARSLATELGSAVLITRHGEGHGAYPASACVRNLVDQYLISLAVPDAQAADCPS